MNDWKKVLFDQFHDIMPGSGIAINYVDAARDLGVVELSGDKILSDSLKTLAARVNTEGEGVPVILFNPLSWRRTDVTEARSAVPFRACPAERNRSARLIRNRTSLLRHLPRRFNPHREDKVRGQGRAGHGICGIPSRARLDIDFRRQEL